MVISQEAKDEVKRLYDAGISATKVSKMAGISSPTVYRILRSFGYPRCRRCGVKIEGRRLNVRYCETCRRVVNTEAVMNVYKIRRSLQKPVDIMTNEDLILSPADLSVHGDIYNLNIGALGQSNLGSKFKSKEDEYNAIVKEHKRIFGEIRDYHEDAIQY